MLPVLLYNFLFFKYEFSFLVLLWCFISSFIFPTQHFTAVTTINISNGVEASHEVPVFFWPYHNIHCMGEQKTSAISSLFIKISMKRMPDEDLGKLIIELNTSFINQNPIVKVYKKPGITGMLRDTDTIRHAQEYNKFYKL